MPFAAADMLRGLRKALPTATPPQRFGICVLLKPLGALHLRAV